MRASCANRCARGPSQAGLSCTTVKTTTSGDRAAARQTPKELSRIAADAASTNADCASADP